MQKRNNINTVDDDDDDDDNGDINCMGCDRFFYLTTLF